MFAGRQLKWSNWIAVVTELCMSVTMKQKNKPPNSFSHVMLMLSWCCYYLVVSFIYKKKFWIFHRRTVFVLDLSLFVRLTGHAAARRWSWKGSELSWFWIRMCSLITLTVSFSLLKVDDEETRGRRFYEKFINCHGSVFMKETFSVKLKRESVMGSQR